VSECLGPCGGELLVFLGEFDGEDTDLREVYDVLRGGRGGAAGVGLEGRSSTLIKIPAGELDFETWFLLLVGL
jgi:hypothetical protein